MPRQCDDAAEYKTVAQVSAELKLRALRRLIAQGRVPFILKLGCAWMLPPQAVKFLRKHYPDEKRLGGLAGAERSAKLRKLAARLDPECAKRQRAWKQQYPHGEHNGAVKPRLAARSRNRAGKKTAKSR
jgi:hypothetical protein